MSTEKKQMNSIIRSWLNYISSLSDDSTHPVQIGLRTYGLALCFSLGPSLIPLINSLVYRKSRSSTRIGLLGALTRVLKRELRYDGFAFAVTLSVAGGAALRQVLWHCVEKRTLPCNLVPDGLPNSRVPLPYAAFLRLISTFSPEQHTFLSNVLASSVGVLLIQAGRERRLKSSLKDSSPNFEGMASSTLDLTLILLVRALDALLQSFLKQSVPLSYKRCEEIRDRHFLVERQAIQSKLEREKIKQESKIRQKWTSRVDAFVFWASSARIMWCFFYEPQKLPRSYVKWINTLASLDNRIISALQYIRQGKWSYQFGSPLHSLLLQASAEELGYPASWGDPTVLPAYGGNVANKTWQALNVHTRPGVGGIPCEILHAEFGSSLGMNESCTANASFRMLKGFKEGLALYLPVHFIPVLLTRPKTLFRPHRLLETLLNAIRSASFLSSFIGLYWYGVCFTRTLVLAKNFPSISHDFWDGPYGCIMAGSLVCGSSIWIENGRRRGEMALYVLPRAIRSCLPDAWLKSGKKWVKFTERLVFIFSISTLLTAAIHRPDALRGLSRWTLAFVTNGPNTGFWKRRRRDPSIPPTPSVPPIPFPPTGTQSRL